MGVVRTWSDEVARGIEHLAESRSALAALARDTTAVGDLTLAVRSGGASRRTFDAVHELAEGGNGGLWKGWTEAEAAQSAFARALAEHPGGAGQVQLMRAQLVAEQASGDLGNWIATGGRGASFDAIAAMVAPHLDDARAAAQRVLASA